MAPSLEQLPRSTRLHSSCIGGQYRPRGFLVPAGLVPRAAAELPATAVRQHQAIHFAPFCLKPQPHAAAPAASTVLGQHHHHQQLRCRQPAAKGPAAFSRAVGICRAASSSAAAFSDDGRSSSSSGGSRSSSPGLLAAASSIAAGLTDTARDLQDLIQRFLTLWRSFLPMLSLFFCLSFINTILDSLKDTLVITAVGGGAFVIPYLTVYAVLPLSMVFLVAYSAASHQMSRAALFNAIVAIFMAFFAAFALFLYPNADVLHPHALADQLQQSLPQGLAGAVGMFRNWTYTLFFCMSELWGDVCMGLLFWGLANEITNLSDAATLYPLFGLGANLAQALAGLVLKATTCRGTTDFGGALQLSMAAVIGIAGVSIVLQQHITNQAAAAARQRHRHLHRHNSSNLSSVADASRAQSPVGPQQQQQQDMQKKSSSKQGPSVVETFKVLAASIEIRCLAVMSLAQGLCNSLMEFAWKCHMRILYPSPADFTAFLGDVATWSGVVTAGLMLLSPLLFERLGWRGVAGATPKILLYGGTTFFAACIVYQHMFGSAVAAAGASGAGPTGLALLQGLVMFGALLYVFGKGAKFSLFKPAEEMVYITLDEDGRTRGKAAIDVVGAQTGKSGGSLLQQALLLFSAGSITGIMPVLFLVFFLMLRGWTSAVHTLSSVRHYSYDSPVSSMEEDEETAAATQASLAAALQEASSSGSDGSSTRLTAAEQQELQQQLQALSNGTDGAGGRHHPAGTKAYQAAVSRSNTSSSNPGSSASDSSSGVNGASSVPAAAEGPSDGQGYVTLSHDAERAFRRSTRASPGSHNTTYSSSNSSSHSADAESISSSSSSSRIGSDDGGGAV